MCWTYFHRDWLAILLLLGRIRLAYTVGDSSQRRRKGWRFIQKENPPEISRLSNAGGGVEKITFSLFSPLLFQRNGDDSSRKKWKYQGSVEEENGRAHQRLSAGVCPHLSFSLSLSHLLSRRRAHTSHRLLSARQTAVFNLCDNTYGWPLICKGKPGAAPIWISTHLGYQGSEACAHRQAERDEPGLALTTGAWNHTAQHNTTQKAHHNTSVVCHSELN